ncbi:N-alkane-inducible cytochrome P450 [Botrytis cinerea]
MRSHTHLESLMNHHMETGHTFTENSLGTTTIFTIDPQNIQTYYSTNCKDYGVHRLRKRAFYPLLGDSVLSTDRIGNTSALIRPMFIRFNVAIFLHLKYVFKSS